MLNSTREIGNDDVALVTVQACTHRFDKFYEMVERLIVDRSLYKIHTVAIDVFIGDRAQVLNLDYEREVRLLIEVNAHRDFFAQGKMAGGLVDVERQAVFRNIIESDFGEALARDQN